MTFRVIIEETFRRHYHVVAVNKTDAHFKALQVFKSEDKDKLAIGVKVSDPVVVENNELLEVKE